MGLSFPLNSSQTAQAAQNNLSVLLCAKNTGEDVTNEVVRKAFETYQNSKLGFVHYAKKCTSSVAAYGAVLGLPIATSLGSMYWFLKDYINDPTLIGKGPSLWFMTALGSAVAVDRVFNEKYDISPIKSAAKWSFQMMSTVLLYAAYKAGEYTGASYLQDEEAKNEARKQSHQKIIEQLQTIYENVAEEFFKDYEKVANSPKEMVRFRHMVEQLEENFPYIVTKLQDLDLKPFEINQIMHKLMMVVTTIKELALGFRQGKLDVDILFNMELLKTLPTRDIASIAIPNDVKNHLKIAEYNDIGAFHKIKSMAVSGAVGATAVAAYSVAIAMLGAAVIYATGNEPTPFVLTAITAFGTPLAIHEAVNIANDVFSEYDEERLKAELRKELQVVMARDKLSKIYNDLASYFWRRSKEYSYNPFEMMLLLEDAKIIFPKLPLIEEELSKIDVMQDSESIIKKLRTTLSEIIAKELP